MAASLFDSTIYAKLFPTGEAGKLFSDTAEIRAMLLVEGALAKVQGAQGLIPEMSAQAIHRATMELQIDPAGLGRATGQNGVPVPALLDAFRSQMQAPEHAQYVHWGATSQDIMDTALMLRLRQVLAHAETTLDNILTSLAQLAADHADLPMAGRTYGQIATPTSFGAVVASWGHPLCDLRDALSQLREGALWVSLSGAAGTASALGPQARETRAQLAQALGLSDPGRSWHTDRGPILRIALWLAQISAALAKIGTDLNALTQTGIGEVTLTGAGASSTMPQKQNPVVPSALVALNTQAQAQLSAVLASAPHHHQRDGAAWFGEWASLPQLVLGTLSALTLGQTLFGHITPNATQMARGLAQGYDTIHAETLSFALARHLPRTEAQAVIKTLSQEAAETQTSLLTLVQRDWPDAMTPEAPTPSNTLGTAPADARHFAKRATTPPK